MGQGFKIILPHEQGVEYLKGKKDIASDAQSLITISLLQINQRFFGKRKDE